MHKMFFGIYALVLSLFLVAVTESTSLAAGNTISGSVKNIKDAGVASAKITLKGEGTRAKQKTYSDENGFFEFTDLAPDAYRITIKKKNYLKSIQTVEVEQGSQKEIEVVMAYDLTGAWKGYFETNLVPKTNITLNLKQSGSTVEGVMTSTIGMNGEVEGTVNGDMAELQIKTKVPFCPGNFEGTAEISDDGNEMELLTMSGSDCFGEHTDGSGYAKRQRQKK